MSHLQDRPKTGGTPQPPPMPRSKHESKGWLQIAALAGIAILAILWLPNLKSEDIPFWLRWMATDLNLGIVGGYHQVPGEYPPLCRLILAIPAQVARATGGDLGFALKASFLVAMFTGGALFYWSTRDRWITLALLAASLVNNLGIGYQDAFVAPVLTLSMHFLWKERWLRSFVFLILASFIKWQPGILAPFIAVYIARRLVHESRGGLARGGWAVPIATNLVVPAVAIPAAFYAVFGPLLVVAFLWISNNMFLNGNALNLNYIYTVLLHVLEPGRFGTLGVGEVLIIGAPGGFLIAPKVIFWAAYVLLLLRCARSARGFTETLSFAILGYFTYFMFNTGAHENHLITILVPLAYLAHVNRPFRPVAGAIALLANLNMVIFYGFDGTELQYAKTVSGAIFLSVLSLGAFAVYLWTARTTLRGSRPSKS